MATLYVLKYHFPIRLSDIVQVRSGQKRFSKPNYTYHKFISALELLASLTRIAMAVSNGYFCTISGFDSIFLSLAGPCGMFLICIIQYRDISVSREASVLHSDNLRLHLANSL